jgi:hypothetical protein
VIPRTSLASSPSTIELQLARRPHTRLCKRSSLAEQLFFKQLLLAFFPDLESFCIRSHSSNGWSSGAGGYIGGYKSEQRYKERAMRCGVI